MAHVCLVAVVHVARRARNKEHPELASWRHWGERGIYKVNWRRCKHIGSLQAQKQLVAQFGGRG